MNAFIVEAKRTPIGRSHKDKGYFRNLRADELLSVLLRYFAKEVLEASKFDDVYIGCVGQHLEQGKNIARLSSLLAGFPDSVPGVTINRLCASSLQAFNFSALTVSSHHAQAILAGGVEHMHHVPMTAALDYHQDLLDRYEFPFTNMGLTAEKVAEKFNITRFEQDEFSLESHRKAIRALEEDWFKDEIVPVEVDDQVLQVDQCPRKESSLESLSQLKTIFKDGGTVTAGNSSPLNDGASLTLVANETFCHEHSLEKKAEIIGFEAVGVDPTLMGLGPVPAIRRLLHKNNLAITDIDLFEINEAFASQSIACIRELGISSEKVNPCGGAIALGHPLGCTGTRLVATLVNSLKRMDKEWGVVSMCIGHGQGIATLIRRRN